MKPSHTQTPRTLSDCTFVSGYPSRDFGRRAEAGLSVLLAVIIGVVGAMFLVHWWSA